jgi:hypothetical protein
MRRFLQFTKLDRTMREPALDVTGQSDNQIERCLRGMLINISDEWFVDDYKADQPKPPIPAPPSHP